MRAATQRRGGSAACGGGEIGDAEQETRRSGGDALGRQVELLREHLVACPREELLGFQDRWKEVDARVFTWPVWDAACLLLGFVSDDFFYDVRAWIISHGRATVDRVVGDPDSLVELADDMDATDTGDAERLHLLIWDVWHERFRDDEDHLPESPWTGHGPTGQRIDLKDKQAVCARFPRLADFAAVLGSPE